MIVEYSSNNSGGRWWLSDKDWLKLELAGWKIRWVQSAASLKQVTKRDRFLGAAAMYATKEFDSLEQAMDEFERVTGQDARAIGCRCCGTPHSFYEVIRERSQSRVS